MTKDTTLTIRIKKQDKETLRRDAMEEGRSVASFVIWLWKEWKLRRMAHPKG